ncbi:MAG: serine/threonine-protein kinase, partial [Betaproteobacteria bacterium]|nr:serine/threonine-protein kinase [Betaproteobacteria bacterium]
MTQSAVYRNALAPQSMLHEYRLESVLGAGSFGVTYLGWDTHLEKHVAIKEYLPAELAMRAADGSVVPLTTEAETGYKWGLERYILEARTLAKFSHPNIVRVNRYFEANGTGYMVMDYERGEPLAALLKRAPRPDEAFLRRMLAPLLEGLRAVHAAGFLHRDIKPDNIFLRADGSPTLIDFGAARQSVGDATRTLTAVLTPGYAPLEQYFSEGHQGPWTDLYALAGVLYRAVTDEPPPDAVTRLKGDRVGEVLARARGRYSEPFLKALRWALAPEEKKRPQSVEEWQRALAGAPAPAPGAPAAGAQD